MGFIKNNQYRISILKLVVKNNQGKRSLFCVFLFCLIIMVATLLVPYVYRFFLDVILIEGRIDYLWLIVVAYLVLYIISSTSQYFKVYFKYKFINENLVAVKQRIWKQYFFRTNISSFESVGDVYTQVINDVDSLKTFADVQTADYLLSIITIAITFSTMCIVNIPLSILFAIFVPIMLMLNKAASIKEEYTYGLMRKNGAKNSSFLSMAFENWKEIRALGIESREIRTYASNLQEYAIIFSNYINYWTLRALAIPRIKNQFVIKFLLYCVGGLLIMKGKITIGTLLFFGEYLSLFQDNVDKVVMAEGNLISLRPSLSAVQENLNRKFLRKGTKSLPNGPMELRINNLHFSYTPDKKIFNGLSFSANEGDCILITGESGRGKTTLINLILGVLTPISGEILINGNSISDILETDLYNAVSVVSQNDILFNDSIRENLRYGCFDADEDSIIDACKKVRIDDFICSQPDGLDSVIGGNGAKLSGGERQRILLARAIIKGSPILILDEATNALDRQTENEVFNELAHIFKDKIVLIISHKMEACDLYTRVISLVDAKRGEGVD